MHEQSDAQHTTCDPSSTFAKNRVKCCKSCDVRCLRVACLSISVDGQGDARPIKNVSHDAVLLVKGLWLVLRATVAKALVPAVGSTHTFLSVLSCC